ncbi:uncharacterized protein TNCT_164181 [Trichonephila clavata]|uniref:Uncharacterized protein n=1 Tax=Trichonephila clavata TaxID=2740835 RepID=A0A8X6FHJ1_TRICU|nr:uncharacterized protein TNCT_164181 [Trichonephila clavata]
MFVTCSECWYSTDGVKVKWLMGMLMCVFQDRQFVELEVPYNGQPNRPSSTPPLSPTPTLSFHDKRLFRSCCGRRKKYQHRTTVTISDPEEEEMNDIRLRRTSSRRRPTDHKYARFPPMVMISTPLPSDDPSDTPSPNLSAELVRISTL